MRTERRRVWVLLGLLVLASQTCAQYWYGNDGPIPLVVDSSRVLIKFDGGFSPDDQTSILRQIERIESVIDDRNVIDEFVACSLSTGAGLDAFLDSIKAIDGVYLVEPYYRSIYGDPMVVGDRFCVAFNTDLSSTTIDSLNALFKVTTDCEIIGLPNTFVLRNTDSSGHRLVEMANLYHELSETRYAHPDFHASIEPNGFYKLYDYYNGYQPHLKRIVGQFNTGPTIWDFAGINKPITVAVLDDGVTAHEDLPTDRILPGIDVSSHPADNDPSPGSETAHGMACAGIIGAAHTIDSNGMSDPNTGLISIDPYTRIMAVKIFNDIGTAAGVTWSDVASAVGYAWTHGADILSCSWGSSYAFDTGYTVLNNALMAAFTQGRNGLGCPLIFSAGNFGDYFPGILSYPAKLDSCFAVGATTLDDTLWYYSCRGPALDISAPSSDICLMGKFWALDQMGWGGYNFQVPDLCDHEVHWECPDTAYDNDYDYDCHFGGTSAACPQVAGTTALLLSRDSTLTVQEVYEILRHSALGGPSPHGSAAKDVPDTISGRLDAFRALLTITRGDANNSGHLESGDAVYIVAYLFRGGPPPVPDVAIADANCDGRVTLADATYIVRHVFEGGPLPGLCYKYDY